MSASDPLLVLLLGPTASGKTALSLALAEHFGGEIVSCDSIAVYREMEIGSAKPSPAERARVPHHLIDVFAPDEWCTAGDYSRLARSAIAQTTARGHLPIVTGGTGFYLRALTDGLFPGPPRSTELRARLEKSAARHAERSAAAILTGSSAAGPDTVEAGSARPGAEAAAGMQTSPWLHRLLRRIDPAAATRIHPNDTPKLIRALEVCLSARQPITQAWEAGRDPFTGYRLLRIGLNPPRPQLYDRINQRARAMFERGLIDETRALIDRYGSAIPTLDALGYRQARQLLAGELSPEAAIAAAQQGHRNYAKRQLTWFRREPDVHWIDDFGDNAAAFAAAESLIAEALC
jgi:tRNA dimethylallyltransferase